MPFELLKGVGKDYAYNPMLHGFSQREIKDTIRRMEKLMEDLEVLVCRKEKEKKRLEGLVPMMDWIGTDVNRAKREEAYDQACWAAMDKAGIEMELPVIQDALQLAPEETPPLRHVDYQARCQNLQERRGEYWKINPGFLDFHPFAKEGAEGLGLQTPEQEKYWPTHQVPWQQGAPSPPPLPPPTPPPLPHPFRRPRPWRQTAPAASRQSTLQSACPPPGAACTPPSSINEAFLDSGPLFTPPTEGGIDADKDLEELQCIIDDVQGMVADVLRIKSLAHDTIDDETPDSPDQPDVQEYPEGEPFEPQSPVTSTVQETCPPQPCPEPPPASPPDSPQQLITEQEFESVACDDFLAPHDGPCECPTQQPCPESPEGSGDWGILDENTLAQGFSPQQYGVNEMESMMGDAAQRANEACIEAELLDPLQFQQCFSPEVLDDSKLQRMLRDPKDRELIISPGAQQGLQIMGSEATDLGPAGRHGFMREEEWNERVCRWRDQEDRQREEERMRGQSAHARQMDAQSLFGVHSRGLDVPCTPPPRAPTYMPETIPWGQSPVDRISPPPTRMAWQPPENARGKMWKQRVYRPVKCHTPVPKSTRHIGRGKRMVRPKPNLPPRPKPCDQDMPPSRTLYPETKAGPTVDEPDRPTTSNCIYNTRQGRYEYLDRSPEYADQRERDKYLQHHRQRYERRLIPGPGVVPPRPAPPPPLPPPECGPEPEHMSVYIPESVDESPNTFKQSLNEAVCRFEQKLERVKQRMGPMLKHYLRSPWVQKEYGVEGPSKACKMKEDKIKKEIQARKKWDSFMLGKYGSVPSPDRYGKMRGIRTRTASTYRPRPEMAPPLQRTRAPVATPEDEPMYGPWLPWVAGSNRPPPRTAAGRISSPYSASPKPAFRKPAETPRGPCVPQTSARRPAQPAQVQYGSGRAPPKTAASYKYQATPPCRPSTARTRQPRRIVPSTPQMMYGSARAPPRTASRLQPQTPARCPRQQTPTSSSQPQFSSCPPSQPPPCP